MIVVVVGMHRSGTSLVGGLLHNSGISMGIAFRKALPENARGFFEDEDFRRLNDEVLEHGNHRVKAWCLNFAGLAFRRHHVEAGTALVLRRQASLARWGWKDPRTCLTLGFWLEVLDRASLLGDLRLVLVDRDERAVAESLLRRGNVPDRKSGVEWARMYRRSVETAMDAAPAVLRTARISYEGLLYGKDVDALERFCDVSLDRDFVDLSLNHCDRNLLT